MSDEKQPVMSAEYTVIRPATLVRLRRIELTASALAGREPRTPFCECVFCDEAIGCGGIHPTKPHAADCPWQALVRAVRGEPPA